MNYLGQEQKNLFIIAIVSDLKYSDALSVIIKQLIRSVTSVAANYRAVCRARSEKKNMPNSALL
jgi:four helix bundle protein